jgi:hypothetical protein
LALALGAPIDLLDIGMILGRREHTRYDTALIRHAHALFDAQLLDPVQSLLLRSSARG